ncbi:hypothetical protein [Caulobacter sp. BK020]|uniref:hypothetical protein n=1 Tax=Caulobacter sp. BK020 TaxID=2512117 RepID=UPI0010507DFC|nr:hypothetical protein [Caulobacter sp. BK020]TCS12100.1 hypothetical protein EV278_11542 [Caulobacter sp. BK020]
MRLFGDVRPSFLAWALAAGLSSLAAAAVADPPPPSASPTPVDGVIQALGVSPSRLGANADQLTVLPTGAPGPVTLTVDRPADKQALDLGARPGDRVWLTVDDPLSPQHVVQITRLARPVPVLQRTIALVAAFAVIAAFASLATAGRPWRFLVGNDNRMSNSQTQMALWFGVVAMVYGATLILRAWFLGWEFMGGIAMTTNVLAMTGLSGLSFGAAKVVAVQKDANAAAAPAVDGAPAPPGVAPRPRIADLVLNDYGAADLGDFQMILISSVATLIFAAASWEFLTMIDIVRATTLPDVDTALLGSFGVGQGAYLIKKAALPNGVG